IGQTNQEVVSFTPRKIGWNDFEVKTALILDSNGNACESIENSKTIKVFVFDEYTTSVEAVAGSCGGTTAELKASVIGDFLGEITSFPTPDGYIGQWKITDAAGNAISPEGKLSKINPSSNYAQTINDPHVLFTTETVNNYNFSFELI